MKIENENRNEIKQENNNNSFIYKCHLLLLLLKI